MQRDIEEARMAFEELMQSSARGAALLPALANALHLSCGAGCEQTRWSLAAPEKEEKVVKHSEL